MKNMNGYFQILIISGISIMGEGYGGVSHFKIPNIPTFAFLYLSLDCILSHEKVLWKMETYQLLVDQLQY